MKSLLTAIKAPFIAVYAAVMILVDAVISCVLSFYSGVVELGASLVENLKLDWTAFKARLSKIFD